VQITNYLWPSPGYDKECSQPPNLMVNLLSVILIGSILLAGCSSLGLSQQSKVTPTPLPAITGAQSLPIVAKIVINKTTINLEAANTPREQEIGLMFRTSMPADRGMIFNFPTAVPANFWMKNTLIPLDIIFLRNRKVMNIQAHVPPCKTDPCPGYGPTSNVLIDQVIELNAGQAKKLGLKVGDELLVQPLASPVASPFVKKRK
jgi:uncharacterized protein